MKTILRTALVLAAALHGAAEERVGATVEFVDLLGRERAPLPVLLDERQRGEPGAERRARLLGQLRGPAQERLREALCTVGNGYLATRGAAPESVADGVHYPGTYVAGSLRKSGAAQAAQAAH